MKKFIILLMTVVSLMSSTLQAQISYNLEEILPKINADSLLRTVLDLQNFGSRFTAREGGNRDVAEYLVQRLNAYGCATEIDSFYIQGYSTIIGVFVHQWFYNVKGVLPADNPVDDSLVIVGSHLDAIAFGIYNSLVDAPGADDNASGVAVMIELARICHEENLHFRRDIHFMAFDCEEFGLIGSGFDAKKRSENGEKIALMMNNDMVSYQPDEDWKLYLYWYENARDVVSRAAVLCAQYTDLVPVIASDLENMEHKSRGDSYSYYWYGYRAIYAQEYTYSTSYHTGHDVADSNNYDYLAEVSRYNMVLLAAYANPESGITSMASATRVYPNPTRDKVTLQYILDENTPVHIAVYDMQGRNVLRKDKAMQENGLHHLELDLSDLKAGLYVIQFRTYRGVETFKVVRE